MRQLREWLLLLRAVLTTLSNQCKDTMEEVMLSWRDRGRGGGSTNLDGTGTGVGVGASAGGAEGDVALPLGPGEWEDGLGLPLCVVCQNVGPTDCPADIARADNIPGWEDGVLGKEPRLERGRL